MQSMQERLPAIRAMIVLANELKARLSEVANHFSQRFLQDGGRRNRQLIGHRCLLLSLRQPRNRQTDARKRGITAIDEITRLPIGPELVLIEVQVLRGEKAI